MLIYVSGPYSALEDADGKEELSVGENIRAARAVAVSLWEMGHAVICPHLNTAHFEADCACSWDHYMSGDLMMVARCDALVMVGPWHRSRGAVAEHGHAIRLNIPTFDTYYNSEELPSLHSTEVRCPEQSARFAEVLGMMYRTHLQKNADYSPANIGGLGQQGVCVRLWDKTCRILNLLGWKFRAEFESLEPVKVNDVPDETIDDTLGDLANYAVIAQLQREGVWGK